MNSFNSKWLLNISQLSGMRFIYASHRLLAGNTIRPCVIHAAQCNRTSNLSAMHLPNLSSLLVFCPAVPGLPMHTHKMRQVDSFGIFANYYIRLWIPSACFLCSSNAHIEWASAYARLHRAHSHTHTCMPGQKNLIPYLSLWHLCDRTTATPLRFYARMLDFYFCRNE